ncbi:MAG: hypothetical protein JW838_11135 [Spirochaetes bacterium]|nr:hypothetical protein [Spirochaetota bacterium]
MKKIGVCIVIILVTLSLVPSCKGEGGDIPLLPALFSGRSYHMGFTPFPSEAGSFPAMEFIYDAIGDNADLVAHHFDNGIPWDESLSGDPYPSNIQFDWDYRRTHTPAKHKVYVAVTPLDSDRDALAPEWTAVGDNQPLTHPWDGYAAANEFNHDDVKDAYLNYCRRVVDYFDPDYLAFGIEVNLLKHNTPAAWAAYLELHQHVYAALKAEYPRLPIMATLTGMDLLEGYTAVDHADQMAALADVIDYTDYYAISLHPHLSAIIPDLVVPDDMFEELFSLSDKPPCITETSFLAETLTMIDYPTYLAYGTPEKQRDYVNRLLSEADRLGLRFVVYFLVRDYDALWVQLGSPENILKAWRDTGLYDENGNPRPALEAWRSRL